MLDCNVTFVIPRWLSLYTRKVGIPSVTVGDASEKRAFSDARMYSTRFGGLASWRISLVDYVRPFLADNFGHLFDIIRELGPDLIISTAQGLWGGLSAVELDIPWASFHLYPELVTLNHSLEARVRKSRFAAPLNEWLWVQETRLGVPLSSIPSLNWGISPSNVVGPHDPKVVTSRNVPALGFPYLDDVFPHTEELDEAKAFLGDSPPVGRIVVSLGSFIGLIDSRFWSLIRDCADHLSCRFVLVGLGEADRHKTSVDNILPIGQVPLSQLLPYDDLFIHHGGIGSMYAGLLSGVPCLTVPHAFDQGSNARTLARLGVGGTLPVDEGDIAGVIRRALDDREMASKAQELASQLVPPEEAAMHVAHRLLDTP